MITEKTITETRQIWLSLDEVRELLRAGQVELQATEEDGNGFVARLAIPFVDRVAANKLAAGSS
jgi:hypothetical protein